MGLLSPSDWYSEWIYKEDQLKTDHNWYRKTFSLKQTPQSAYIYVASFGYHELYVNGEKVTENVLVPVQSFLKKHLPYLTYDIKDKLQKGKNVISVWHAAGWSRWKRVPEYRNPPFVFKAQAEIIVQNKLLRLPTNNSWKCKKSNSSYYGNWDVLGFGGEIVDDRLKDDNWNRVNYNDSQWAHACVYDGIGTANNTGKIDAIEDKPIDTILSGRPVTSITAQLCAQRIEPQVKYREIHPISVKKDASSNYIIDMGENYSGFFEMDMYKGNEGDTILFQISDKKETACTWNQKSEYIYGKDGKGYFSNRFNLAGGRWITITGLKYTPSLSDIKGYVITCNRKRISEFECSNTLLNKIYKVNLDTYIANTLDGILVDCPHRERRGWGEVTVAAMYGDALPNFESGAYMDQYTQFMRDAQLPDGRIRGVINEVDREFLMWEANNPITVWETYKMYGDKKLLRDNYISMKKWMNCLLKHSDYDNGGGLKHPEQGNRHFPGLGDWCTPRGNFWDSSNSAEAIHFNNCVYAYMLQCAIHISYALHLEDDVTLFKDRLTVQQKAIQKLSYDSKTGLYQKGYQVDQAFALLAGATPDSLKQRVCDNLVDNILYSFPYYDTGSSGQALYTRFFIEYGERMDLIYQLLKDSYYPSYGYFIRLGDNVWPERWCGIGNSRIHTCYTGIGGYFIKGFGGIRPDIKHPGMKSFIIKPNLVGDLTHIHASFESQYGHIGVHVDKKGKGAVYRVTVPVNTTAKLYIQSNGRKHVLESGLMADKAESVTYIGTEKNDAVGHYTIYKIGSGSYKFIVDSIPVTSFPKPLYEGHNLSRIARANASSMKIISEKEPTFETFKVNDGNVKTAWKANGKINEWVEMEWIEPQTFNQVVINEVGDNIDNYKLEYWNGSSWILITSGNDCGANKTIDFKKVSTRKCRLFVVKAKQLPSIAEMSFFEK